MSSFEEKYYESDSFWDGTMVRDDHNLSRFITTSELIPHEVQSLLDAGCGNGVFVQYLQKNRNNIDIHALDRSVAALKHVGVNKTVGDVSKMPFESNNFDCVSCLEVLEHLPVDVFDRALSELARVSKKYLLISVPYNEALEDSYTKCPGCKTIFNCELHLRNFNDDEFANLFIRYGFKQIKMVKAGPTMNFRFHKTYRKIFYSEQLLTWRSPICPLCGYQGNGSTPTLTDDSLKNGTAAGKRKLISYLSKIPKLIWPKEVKNYWIIGLYEKNSFK
jgi:ubiquinone/menaquinone biosynthesis C-methylase UbiE